MRQGTTYVGPYYPITWAPPTLRKGKECMKNYWWKGDGSREVCECVRGRMTAVKGIPWDFQFCALLQAPPVVQGKSLVPRAAQLPAWYLQPWGRRLGYICHLGWGTGRGRFSASVCQEETRHWQMLTENYFLSWFQLHVPYSEREEAITEQHSHP